MGNLFAMMTPSSINENSLVATDGFSPAEVEARTGYLHDFISGQQVKATPEEVDAVQVFSRRLVEDYGYHKEQIQTRPQFGVRRSPSDEKKSYPIDIAVFHDDKPKTEDNLFLIVECKKKTRKDGVNQLKIYMDLSTAHIGVWFNGEEHLYLRKIHLKDGGVAYKEMPAIPRRGQRMEDIGLYLRRDLKVPSNLKAVFRDLRHHLAGNTTGITRDETLAQEIINLLFCKIYDELNTGLDENVTFRSGLDEDPADVKARIVSLFEDRVKAEYADVFSEKDAINLDADSLVYVVGELQNYVITEADRDAVGDAFEVFIGPALRGGEGQFFTPRNVVKMMIDILNPRPGEMIIDPACGSGGFLIMALEYVWRQMDAEGEQKGFKLEVTAKKKQDIATRCFRGLDKDSFLAKVTKAYMAIIGDGRGGVFCENSLLPPAEWGHATRDKIKLGQFDVILTNPPFGAKIPVKGVATLSQYALGHKWSKDKTTGDMAQGQPLHDDQPPQILFLERCLQLLKPGGRLGIILPESAVSNPSYKHLIAFIMQNTQILGVVTLPEHLFKTSGKGGTHTKVCALFLRKGPPPAAFDLFMSDVKWCGHDSRGNPTIRENEQGEKVLLDEVPDVAGYYFEEMQGQTPKTAHEVRLGFVKTSTSLVNGILVPKFYDPSLDLHLAQFQETHDLLSVRSLVEQKALQITTGVEIGKMSYGTGTIPFVRTSDISNWEVKADFKHGVSKSIYNAMKSEGHIQADDILMVRDGTYLVGTSAIITQSDLPMLFQSHLYCLRVLKPEVINPWLLFACLNTIAVRRQIRAKQFTQDIIDTLGDRIHEIVLPVPKDPQKREHIITETRRIVETRVALRNYAQEIVMQVEGIAAAPLPAEDGPDAV